MDEAAVTRALGYTFSDASLLRTALTHRSHGSQHNERLEFLGDSVLNCAIATELYGRFPRQPEGDLSRIRANLVRQQTLFELARELRLGEHVRLGEGELKSGGFRRPSILADALEAVIGAVYLDGGFPAAAEVVRRIFATLLDRIDPVSLGKDPKTLLQEWMQGRKMALPQYSIVATTGEAHDQHFQVECVLADLSIRCLGEGSSRRAAEQDAARRAYELAAKR